MRGSLILFVGLSLTVGWFCPSLGVEAKQPPAAKTVLNNLPEKTLFSAVAFRGAICAFKFAENEAPVTYAFDPHTARGRTGTVVLDGKIYVLGGAIEGGAHTGAVEACDPARDVWTARAPWIFEREPLDMAAVDGRLFVFGAGAFTDSCAHSFKEYDFRSDRWLIRSDMPAANAHTVHPAWAVLGDGRTTLSGTTPEPAPGRSCRRWTTASSTCPRWPPATGSSSLAATPPKVPTTRSRSRSPGR